MSLSKQTTNIIKSVPKPAPSQNNNDKLVKVAIGVGVAALVAGAIWYITRSSSSASSSPPPSTTSTNAAAAADDHNNQNANDKNKSKATKKKKKEQQWNDSDVQDMIEATLEAIQQCAARGLAPSVDASTEKQIRSAVQQVADSPANAFSNATREKTILFFITINSVHLNNCNNEDEFNRALKSQEKDMAVAWTILEQASQIHSNDDELDHQLDRYRIQVSQGLKRADYMFPIFTRMIARGSWRSNSEEGQGDLVFLFTSAPLLGKWATTVELGDKLATQGNLEEFHEAPMDYYTLYQLSKKQRAKGDAPIESLLWQNYQIVYQRIRLASIDIADDATRSTLEAEFTDQDGNRAWKILKLNDSSKFVRCGALCQVQSFSPLPIALIGPCSDNEIYAQGYGDMRQSPVTAMRQVETYQLRSVSASQLSAGDALPASAVCWKGSYEMVQHVLIDNAQPSVKLTFDLEMAIQPIDE